MKINNHCFDNNYIFFEINLLEMKINTVTPRIYKLEIKTKKTL
jgi:hypothetical protein